MMVYAFISEFVEFISKLKEKLNKHGDLFSSNEAAVRYAIVNPFLKMLGWDVENPEEVIPEYSVPKPKGKADYALFIKELSKNPIAFVEVKKLNGINSDVIREKLKYSFDLGVNYTIITDGDSWILYKAFEPDTPASERIVAQWSILKDDPYEIAFKALIIARTKFFGKLLEEATSIKTIEQQTLQPTKPAREVVKPPFSRENARKAILKILSESTSPMRRKDLVEKVGQTLEISGKDLEPTPKAREPRWRVITEWTIYQLKGEGLIEAVETGHYSITEKGRKVSGLYWSSLRS
jgi:predicted type IV restriction endonuclease